MIFTSVFSVKFNKKIRYQNEIELITETFGCSSVFDIYSLLHFSQTIAICAIKIHVRNFSNWNSPSNVSAKLLWGEMLNFIFCLGNAAAIILPMHMENVVICFSSDMGEPWTPMAWDCTCTPHIRLLYVLLIVYHVP